LKTRRPARVNQKTFDSPRCLSGHTVAAQTPWLKKVFCAAPAEGLFFKTALLASGLALKALSF
jgi:hypothetical protein